VARLIVGHPESICALAPLQMRPLESPPASPSCDVNCAG